jgi:drug/metabolite transporter (DMT)-like permease
MTDLGKAIMLFGVVLAVIGALVWALGKSGLRGLPGDVSYQGEHVRFYFPIVTCIVVSIVLTLAMWLWRWFTQQK